MKGNPDGDMVAVKRVNATTVESSYTLKGKPTTNNSRVVSADGKTVTVTSTGTNGQGQKINNRAGVRALDRLHRHLPFGLGSRFSIIES